jgi:ABC-type glycerol-3-phosphate transport system substrate-binding protein
MQWIGMWAVPGMQKVLGDDIGVIPFPKLDAQSKPAVYSGGWTQFVSAKSANIDAAKKFVKWLWLDKADFQEDWSLNYGFHIPPRKSLAAKASKLQSGVAADTVKLNQDYGHTDNPPGLRRWVRRSVTCSPTSSRREPTPPPRSAKPRRPSTPNCPGCSDERSRHHADRGPRHHW